MIGWALQATLMDPPSLFLLTQIRHVETDGCVSTDGVRSRKFLEEAANLSPKHDQICLTFYRLYKESFRW